MQHGAKNVQLAWLTFDVQKENTSRWLIYDNHQNANCNKIKGIKAKLLANENADRKAIGKILVAEAEDSAVLLISKLRSATCNSFNEVPVFIWPNFTRNVVAAQILEDDCIVIACFGFIDDRKCFD